MAKRGKKYQEALKLVDRSKRYSLEEAVELVKKTNVAKFDATVEVSFKLNIDPRKAEQIYVEQFHFRMELVKLFAF